MPYPFKTTSWKIKLNSIKKKKHLIPEMEVILGDATHTPLVRISSDSHVPLSKLRVPLLRKE